MIYLKKMAGHFTVRKEKSNVYHYHPRSELAAREMDEVLIKETTLERAAF